MAACNEQFLGDGGHSTKAMYHMTNSLMHVRERLEGDDALSDATLGLVISFITQEQIRNEHEAARIHLNGLARMIELRGGLTSLEHSLPILLKTCK